MNNKISTIEEILGISKDSKISIPGTLIDNKRSYIYFEDDRQNMFHKQFNLLIENLVERQAKYGGRLEEGCKIYLPDGTLFYAISYTGDIEGWRKDIEEGAKNRNLLLAWIEGDKFIISDGRSYLLSDCKVEFY